MTKYVMLLRGINVGGKNKVPMSALRECLEAIGLAQVSTYIASGNVVFESDQQPAEITALVERALPRTFKLDTALLRVLVLSHAQLQAVIQRKPVGFGDRPDTYHSDAIFLMGIDAAEAMRAFDPREGVDTLWAGAGVIYSQRLSARRTHSRLNKAMSAPAYKSMTIRNWNTTTGLLAILDRTTASEE